MDETVQVTQEVQPVQPQKAEKPRSIKILQWVYLTISPLILIIGVNFVLLTTNIAKTPNHIIVLLTLLNPTYFLIFFPTGIAYFFGLKRY